jgi:hypothetical protein
MTTKTNKKTMNTETSVTPTGAGLIAQRGDDLEVSAFAPQEMKDANSALIIWCENKIKSMKSEAAELLSAFQQAVEKKWKSSTLKKHADLATKRVTFYEKIKAALEEGFYIVPNFPTDIFAVRTDRTKPHRKLYIGIYEASAWQFKQAPQLLAVGEGNNQPCDPIVSTHQEATKEGDKTKTVYFEEATDWGDITFPIQMAKPKIMEAVGRAMTLKIFDQFGLFAAGTGDPIIVGEIIDPRRKWSPNNATNKRVSFIIAWHLDTRTL